MNDFTRSGSSVFGGVRLDGTPADQWIGNTATARYAPLIVPPLRYPRDLPQFNAEWVRRMLSDSAVQLALAARKAPLLSVEFAYREQGRWTPGVRASDPAIGDFVLRQLQRLWKRGIARLLDSAQIWGWGAGEITFRRTRDAQIEVDQILVRDKDDVRPVVQDGTIIGVEFRRLKSTGTSDRHPDKLALAFPRAIWHAHHPQSGQWFGWTVLAAAFSPWWDKHGTGGALDVRRLFMTKDGYRGTRIYYPSGTSTVQQPDGSIKQIPNQEIAMQIVETIRTGGVFALPSEVDANGTPRWKIEESQVSNNPSHILQYPKELDAEILNAMGIADDVLKSEATGSWAGKAVPQQATYCILEQWLSDLICDVDRVIEKLVEINFGPGHQYELTTRPLADQMLAQQNSPAEAANAPAAGDSSHASSNRAPQPGGMLRMAWDPNQPRAPIGGVQINGKFFEGGQFIPQDDLDKASATEQMILDEKLQSQDQSILPTAEQMEEAEEARTSKTSSSPESDGQTQQQPAQDAPISPSVEGASENGNASDQSLTVSDDLAEQLIESGAAHRFSTREKQTMLGFVPFGYVDTSYLFVRTEQGIFIFKGDSTGSVPGDGIGPETTSQAFTLAAVYPPNMNDGAIKDHFTSFYTTDNPLATAQRTEAALTFALNLVPTGGALDNLTQGNYTEAGISAAADSLLLAGGIVKALSASRASLTAAQAARLNAAAQAIARAETSLDLAVGGYRAGQSFHNFTTKDGSKVDAAGQAGEALLRILTGTIAAKDLANGSKSPRVDPTPSAGVKSPDVRQKRPQPQKPNGSKQNKSVGKSEISNSVSNLGRGARHIDEFLPDGVTAFSGVYDPKTKQLLAYPSSRNRNIQPRQARLKDGSILEGESNNIVARNGGHDHVNQVLSSLTKHPEVNNENVAFTIFLKEDGNLRIEWFSRSVNHPNPNFHGDYVPKSIQSEIRRELKTMFPDKDIEG